MTNLIKLINYLLAAAAVKGVLKRLSLRRF